MPKKTTAPTTTAFPLDWGPTTADIADLQANAIEAAALVLRHFRSELPAHNTLAGLTSWFPTFARKPLGELSADDLVTLVGRLRRAADLSRQRQRSRTLVADDEAS